MTRFWRYIHFSVVESATSLWRSRMLNSLSIGTIMFAMFILGSFIFVGVNLKQLTIDWQDQIQFNIFLRDDIGDEDRVKLEAFLKDHTWVEQSSFISRDMARQRFEGDFAAYEDILDDMELNPFPASFQVSLLQGVKRDTFAKLKDELAAYTGIEDIYYDDEIFARLNFFANLIQLAGWFFGGIMIFSSVFTISNVLKLTFFTRREEVDIMKLVGASRGYIRGPFIVEGVLIGFIGAFFGVALVFLGHLLLGYYLNSKPDFFLGSLELGFLSFRWVLFLIFAGGLSGLIGSIISMHQFLEEHISYQ